MTQPPAPHNAPGAFEYRFTPIVANIRLARRVLGTWLEAHPGAHADAVDDLLVACSELVTNAVLHARTPDTSITLRASTRDDRVVLEVEDQGGGFAWPVDHGLGDVDDRDEHGRGLFIVEALTDHLEVVHDAGRGTTTVRCEKSGVLRRRTTDEPNTLSARFRAEDVSGAGSPPRSPADARQR